MKTTLLITLVSLSAAGLATAADELPAALQAKVNAKMKEVQAWAADPVIVAAVKAHNTGLGDDFKAMTQEKWKSLTVLDPFIRPFSKNPAAALLKSKQGDTVSEAFLSGAEGMKVAFLTKPTNWTHKGKPKHDVPMTGQTWQGPVETDESTGLKQVQVGVPVLDGGKPIGTLVVGISLASLSK